MIRRFWIGLLGVVLVGFFHAPGFAAVQVLAKGLTDPFNVLVDAVNVYWNEGATPPGCKVSQCVKDGSSGATVRTKATGGWPDHPDMTQDSTFLYFPMCYKKAGETGCVPQIVRLAKAGLTAPSPLFKFYYLQDPANPVCLDPGFPAVLEVKLGKVYFSIWDFCESNANEIRRVSSQGAKTKDAVPSFPGAGGGRVTSMVSDNVHLYWGQQGAINRLPLAGGAPSRLATLSGIPGSLVTPTTGAGGGSVFWLEGNLITARIDLKRRAPGGQVSVLAGDLGLFPRLNLFAARSLAVDDKYVYFFRKVNGVNQLARMPANGGAVKILAKGSAVVDPMGLAADGTHVYWADRGSGSGSGSIKRAPKAP